MIARALRGAPEMATLLADFRTREFNYRVGEAQTEMSGWHLDLERQPLPAERLGDPVPGGPWEVARRIVHDYEFVDPALVRGFYDPDEPLERRTMVLELRAWFVRLYVGVRVNEVHDRTLELGGRSVRSWGWKYGTLEGHVEAGERSYEVRKWLDTGEVEFVTSAFSRSASRDPATRLAFKLLGRPRQDRFVRGACDRIATLVDAALADDLSNRANSQIGARPSAATD